MKPLITVLVDTFNHEKYIEQAVVSVLEQNFPRERIEVLVVDDGSTDRTAEIARKFEPRVRLFRKANGGQASAFNLGVTEARGQVVAFLDGDDWWAPGKLGATMEILEKNPPLAAVGHGYHQVKEDGALIATVSPKQACRGDLSSVAAARSAWRLRHFLGGSMICVRSEVLRQMGPIPEDLIFSADAIVFSAALALGGVLVIEKPLCSYRIHSENFFALRSEDAARLRRRTAVYEALVKTTPPLLMRVGVPERRIEAFLEGDELAVESQRFTEERPGRVQFFRHLLKYIRAYRSQMSWKLQAINLVNAFGALLVGHKDFYLLEHWRAGAMDFVRAVMRLQPYDRKEKPGTKE